MFIVLFVAGVLTILLPCILPLLPIVLGVSLAGRSRLRPILTVAGMVVSFVGFTFLLHVVLAQFVEIADYLRIGTYQVLLLFGLGFAVHRRDVSMFLAALSGFFFWSKGVLSVATAVGFGVVAMELGGRAAACLQQCGAGLQAKAREEFGEQSPMTAFLIGLTMGLVWVPCAGPALGFALTLVREEPGPRALFLLSSYALGTALPLLLVGYGGQWASQRVRALSRHSGGIKQVAGWILILTALALQFQWLRMLETWLVQHTSYGTLGTRLEEQYLQEGLEKARKRVAPHFPPEQSDRSDRAGNPLPVRPSHPGGVRGEGKPSPSSSSVSMFPTFPRLARAPELVDLGPWHNSAPLTLKELRGKVVLVDFWTYSCINCIRTLPHIQGYWEKFAKDELFMLIGVHSPEFVFEKSEKNVADAIQRHGLTYPVAQDNGFGTWRAFSNHYWPAKYLIDAEGYIRYTHFGEGAYEETEEAIRSLLEEIGVHEEKSEARNPKFETNEKSEIRNREQTPETYLGVRSWPAFAKATVGRPPYPDDDVYQYVPPSQLLLHTYSLQGRWRLMEGERQVLRGDEGEIRMKFLAGEINLVLGLEDGVEFAEVDVWLDGRKTQSFTVDRDDLYALWKGKYGEHEIVIILRGEGVSAYAFTFGS